MKGIERTFTFGDSGRMIVGIVETEGREKAPEALKAARKWDAYAKTAGKDPYPFPVIWVDVGEQYDNVAKSVEMTIGQADLSEIKQLFEKRRAQTVEHVEKAYRLNMIELNHWKTTALEPFDDKLREHISSARTRRDEAIAKIKAEYDESVAAAHTDYDYATEPIRSKAAWVTDEMEKHRRMGIDTTNALFRIHFFEE